MSKSWLKTPQEQLRDFGDLFDKPKKKWPDEEYDFDGSTYEPKFDATRLRGEMARVYAIMKQGEWLTLAEISNKISESVWQDGWHRDPEASISARLRDLRKAKFGSHTVNRRRRGEASRGIWEYQLL